VADELIEMGHTRHGLALMVRTPETLAQRLARGDSFLGEMINKGTVLYKRADG